ncbi:MAG: FAS1-like dehydratase domain-containing protein, partial [Candidatus Binatia bacterium]
SIIGSVYDESVSEPITRAEIQEFAAAIGERNPSYTAEDAVAPPTFCVRFRGELFFHPKIPRPLLMTGFDAGKDITFGVPVRADDVIRSTSVVHEIYEKTGRTGTMVFIVSRQKQVNQRGEMVAVIDSRFVCRPGGKA